MFGTCSLLTTLVCLAFQPETRGSSLEDVDEKFEHSPWKSLIQNSPFSSLGRVSRVHRRNTSNQLQADDDAADFELDVVHLPQVSFGGHWHYTHHSNDHRSASLPRMQEPLALGELLS